MKNLIFLIGIIIITSCQKEVIYPTDQLPSNVPTADTSLTVNSWGKFIIIDAVMYVDDLQTGEHMVYNHFGVGKDTSSLRWGGPIFDIEEIIRNKTTYSFWKPTSLPGTGRFVLNDDTTKLYLINYIGQYKSIIEHPNSTQQNLGGSSRPFSGQTVDYTNQIVAIQIQETEGMDGNGHPIHYWTELKLQKIESW
jgi:hypothetical protein